MRYYDSEFSTQHMAEANPFKDVVMVDGMIVPLSTIREDLQQMVREKKAEGCGIEFIP
ncbi:MAG: hypothetical protein MI784_18010 [Cytophagales bacterium]|nr:hypothetical protein [Cytophagales bacterium]